MAQTQDSYDYNSEFNWGINKNSSGGLIGGFTLKTAKRINKKMFETYGLEIMNVKNPHEVRVQAASSGNYFIYGKTHYLYALRLQYGRDIILFTKGPQQGVEVKAVFAAGPSIGIVAPYYVQISDNNSFYSYNVAYDGTQPYNDIQGTGSLFQGIGDSKIQMGGNLKIALNFEIGTSKSNVTGFEAGFLLDSYFKKVELMAVQPVTGNPPPPNVKSAENYAVYPTVFLTFFYGSRK
ncbi:hypothetical protein WSM22_11130 [Cytophagales bacterium WSM2-2]|nr:hypothetical protein WSM22_11130 [Cytophagales bacterium WSM2-2]